MPSAWSTKLLTGSASPSILSIGSRMVFTIFTVFARPVCVLAFASSFASAQLAGTSTFSYAVAPASIAL